MSSVIYLEGGGDSKELHARCREGFRGLLEQCRFHRDRLPRLVACGSREAAYSNFVNALTENRADFVALWVDSEDPVADIHATWSHLNFRDGWQQPDDTTNEQVLFSTTCMETLIVADRITIRQHFHGRVQESALPPLVDLEKQNRQTIQDKLTHATRNCSNAFKKGKRSFEVLAKLNPTTLEEHLPSFARIRRILEDKLR